MVKLINATGKVREVSDMEAAKEWLDEGYKIEDNPTTNGGTMKKPKVVFKVGTKVSFSDPDFIAHFNEVQAYNEATSMGGVPQNLINAYKETAEASEEDDIELATFEAEILHAVPGISGPRSKSPGSPYYGARIMVDADGVKSPINCLWPRGKALPSDGDIVTVSLRTRLVNATKLTLNIV